tara:strand:- start:289 stop:576 length:288 start_codon:yes stop_codon:yes gene_type:complete
MNISNRTPIDRLGEIREQIKELQAAEKDLKVKVQKSLNCADRLLGLEFLAVQSIAERKGSIDEKAVCEKFGVENLDDFRKAPVTVITVKTTRITE